VLVLPNVGIDVSFDVANAGHEPTGDFWIAANLGQTRGIPQFNKLETDPESRLVHVPSLKPGGSLHLSGTVVIARTSTDLQVAIVAGCPPGSEPCSVPEIAFENNVALGSIPLPPDPTPTPTATPVIIR
jgi:hypothetical protein